MKANEFVKKHGFDAAKELLENPFAHDRYIAARYDFLGSDLKRLVESHELVEKHGGLLTCKLILQSVDNNESEYGSRLGVEYKKSLYGANTRALMFCDDGNWYPSSYLNFELDDDSKFVNLRQLKQAIADVESCL